MISLFSALKFYDLYKKRLIKHFHFIYCRKRKINFINLLQSLDVVFVTAQEMPGSIDIVAVLSDILKICYKIYLRQTMCCFATHVHINILIFNRFSQSGSSCSSWKCFQGNNGLELSRYITFMFQLILPLIIWLLYSDFTQQCYIRV